VIHVLDQLIQNRHWLVLTGAGVSAESGVPTYRDRHGVWQRKPPVKHQEFIQQHSARQRFWSRNMVGWRFMASAKPNIAHKTLADLEIIGHVGCLVTQNVDGLHQRAGSQKVIDLHGRVDTVTCISCQLKFPRQPLQLWLEQNNPDYAALSGAIAPDGDADIDELDYSAMQIPDCEYCGGILKPDAVFYGDSVPMGRLADAEREMRNAEGLVVIGSSLTTYSGYRFCLWAQQQNKPIVIVNQGATRADIIATQCTDENCSHVLKSWLQRVN
tara:strand:- start:2952 stop:3764 length:813 start_codon:yes stop_codon:yes gene_type:complete